MLAHISLSSIRAKTVDYLVKPIPGKMRDGVPIIM